MCKHTVVCTISSFTLKPYCNNFLSLLKHMEMARWEKNNFMGYKLREKWSALCNWVTQGHTSKSQSWKQKPPSTLLRPTFSSSVTLVDELHKVQNGFDVFVVFMLCRDPFQSLIGLPQRVRNWISPLVHILTTWWMWKDIIHTFFKQKTMRGILIKRVCECVWCAQWKIML